MKFHRNFVGFGAASAVLGIIAAGGPALAGVLTIDPTFDTSITGDAHASEIEAAINAAINGVTSQVSTPQSSLTVDIYFGEMGSGLGESLTGEYGSSYGTYYNALAPVMTQPNQVTALASLPNNGINPVNSADGVVFTPAEGRNLGLATPGYVTPSDIALGFTGSGTYDTIIGLNTGITYPPGSNNGSNYGLQAVANHEIDEALGIGGTGSWIGNGPGFVGDLDLYRYSAPGVRSFTTSSTASSYFSIDGGNTVLSYFNQTAGADYGDWLSNPIPTGFSPQVQDAFGGPGTDPSLGPNELTALNAIGYDVNTGQPVPEPASLTLLGGSLLLWLGWSERRRRKTERDA